jgi:hypothetical protein
VFSGTESVITPLRAAVVYSSGLSGAGAVCSGRHIGQDNSVSPQARRRRAGVTGTDRPELMWSARLKLSEAFGFAVALTLDRKRLAIGSLGEYVSF